jgi:glycosyltransferase involved in cell wall biosynthesis
MRIAFINNFFNAGGSSLASFNLAQTLSKNHEMMFAGCVDGPFREKFSKLGQTYLFANNNFEYDQNLTDHLNRFSPDVIHIFVPGSQQLSFIGTLPKCKLFASVLCGQTVGFDTSKFNKIFFSSEYQRSLSPNVSNFEIVKYGICSTESITQQREAPVFGRVSSFCPSKMIHDTIYCSARMPNNNFIIGGEILDRQYFDGITAYLNYTDAKNTNIFANVSDEQKQEIINSCDVYHYPSSNEAFCFSILEAFSCGKPVISYRNSAIPEMLETDEWLCDDFESLLELTKKMASTSAQDRQTIGMKNFDLYKKYGVDIYAQKIEQEYRN